MARRIDQHLQRLAWLSLGRHLAVAAFLILAFCAIRALERRETLSLAGLLLPLLHGVSESFAHLAALAFFSTLLALRESRELQLLACQYRPAAALLRSVLPVLALVLCYQALYFGFIKPDYKAMGRSGETRAALIAQQLGRHRPVDIKGNWFMCSGVDGTTFADPCYLIQIADGDMALRAARATVHEMALQFGPGRLASGPSAWSLSLSFSAARLPVFSGEAWLDYTKPLHVLLRQSRPLLRVQQRLVQILTPLFLAAFAFFIFSLPPEESWTLRCLFLSGLFAVHLPLQIFTRRFAYDTHGALALMHWLPALALLAYALLLRLCLGRRA